MQQKLQKLHPDNHQSHIYNVHIKFKKHLSVFNTKKLNETLWRHFLEFPSWLILRLMNVSHVANQCNSNDELM